MAIRVKAIAWVLLALMMAGAARPAMAADRPLLRISTENPAGHVHTRIVARFAATLRERLGDRLEVVHEHSAVLFRDRDVITALQQGQVEMAVPGTWQLDRFVPAVGVFQLPAFYGLDISATHALRDGPPGQAISRAIEERLDVVVPGRWLDLGFAHIFTASRTVHGHDDLRDLVVRIPGGEANAARLRALGMSPLVVAWPDLPVALASGKLDGVLTTHETAASGRLWEHGLRHVFEDRQYFAQYVPLVAGRFWGRLPADLRQAIATIWEEQVAPARAEAAAAQEAARAALIAHGVSIVTPTDADLGNRRRMIGAGQDEAIRGLGLGPGVAAAILDRRDAAP